MLPLSPPPGYFKEINSIISKFIWNDKCPRIKLTTLQHPNRARGLAVPNFELYYWSFQLKALHKWVDPQSKVSWRVIEADKVKPVASGDLNPPLGHTQRGKHHGRCRFRSIHIPTLFVNETHLQSFFYRFRFIHSYSNARKQLLFHVKTAK